MHLFLEFVKELRTIEINWVAIDATYSFLRIFSNVIDCSFRTQYPKCDYLQQWKSQRMLVFLHDDVGVPYYGCPTN